MLHAGFVVHNDTYNSQINLLKPGGGRGRLGPVSAGRGRAERLRSFGRETWAPYLADTLLRVFASASVSGQLGRFTRPFLDYTAGSVRLASFPLFCGAFC